MNQEQAQSNLDPTKAILGAVNFACRSMAATVEVFLHKSRSFGERYLGLQAAAGVLCLFFYTAFWRYGDIRPVLGFLVVYLIALAMARFGVMSRVRGGEQVHSFYTGAPRIMRWMGRMSEETVKRLVEPMLVFVIGVFVLQASEPLGTYLMLAGFALFASVNLAAGFDRMRAMDMNDAFLEQRNVAEQFREMRGQ